MEDDVWYTPDLVRRLYGLLAYHQDAAPRLRWFDDLLVPAHAWRNPDEWWWQVRGDLLWALDRIGETGRVLIELCLISVPPLTQDEAAARLGISQPTVSRELTRAVQDAAYQLGWRPTAEALDETA